MVTSVVIDHIVAARNGTEATMYNNPAIDELKPDSYDAVLDRLESVDAADSKGKLIVALRHCHGQHTFRVLMTCLNDQRAVHFEARGPFPHRVCDMAYYVLYMKLQVDPEYHLVSLKEMKPFMDGVMPYKKRDEMIAKLKAHLANKNPFTEPSPVPSRPAASSASASMTV